MHNSLRYLTLLLLGASVACTTSLASQEDAASPAPRTGPVPPPAVADITVGSMKLPAQDLERTMTFYQRVFGLREVGRFDLKWPLDSQRRLREVALVGGKATDENIFTNALILMHRPDEPASARYESDLASLVIIVPNANEIATAAKNEGGTVTLGPIDLGPTMRFLFVRDPSGNLIECVERR